MPILIIAGSVALGGVGFKLFSSGANELSEATLKITGAALAAAGAYAVAKQLKVI
jgi:hypothetical protein